MGNLRLSRAVFAFFFLFFFFFFCLYVFRFVILFKWIENWLFTMIFSWISTFFVLDLIVCCYGGGKNNPKIPASKPVIHVSGQSPIDIVTKNVKHEIVHPFKFTEAPLKKVKITKKEHGFYVSGGGIQRRWHSARFRTHRRWTPIAGRSPFRPFQDQVCQFDRGGAKRGERCLVGHWNPHRDGSVHQGVDGGKSTE